MAALLFWLALLVLISGSNVASATGLYLLLFQSLIGAIRGDKGVSRSSKGAIRGYNGAIRELSGAISDNNGP